MTRTKIFAVFLLAFVFQGVAIAQSRDWIYPPVEISEEDEATLEEAKFLSDAGYWALAIQEYQNIADKYSGTSVEANLLSTIANLTGHLNGPEAGDVVTSSISAKFPNSVFDYRARFELARGRVFRHSPDAVYTEYIAVASDIANADLSNAILGGSPSLNRSVSQLDFEQKLVLEDILRNLVNVFQNKQRYADVLALCRFGRSCFDFEEDGESSFADLTSYALKRSVGPIAKEIGTLPGQLEIQAVAPTPNGVLSVGEKILFSISGGEFRNAPPDLSTLQVFLDGLEVTEQVGLQASYDYSLAADSNYELLTGELALANSPGSHTLEVRITPRQVGDTEPEEISLSWTFTVQEDSPPISTFFANSDTILSQRNQHENEGSNALLTLEKIQGKATRSAISFGFDNDTNLNGLSKATLLLTIDSSGQVNGWGSGRTISVQALNSSWQEGNGKRFGLKKKDQLTGNGAGATWFSPSDEDISNDSANSAVNWNGAAYSASPPTAPPVTISNGLSGEVAFDVTADVLNGAEHGWLILKDQENVGSKVSFYSREARLSPAIQTWPPGYYLSTAKLPLFLPRPNPRLCFLALASGPSAQSCARSPGVRFAR